MQTFLSKKKKRLRNIMIFICPFFKNWKWSHIDMQHCLRMLHIMHTTIMKGGIDQVFYYGYCKDQRNAVYTTTSQWIMRSDTHLSFWHNVKKSVQLKFKIMSITCRFHISTVVLTLYISYQHVRNKFNWSVGCSKLTTLC